MDGRGSAGEALRGTPPNGQSDVTCEVILVLGQEKTPNKLLQFFYSHVIAIFLFACYCNFFIRMLLQFFYSHVIAIFLFVCYCNFLIRMLLQFFYSHVIAIF